jgi:tetratricopeptide (TPR) repeat protein
VGRSRELLAAERLLLRPLPEGRRRFVVLRGEGGEGKTELACELARWLVDSRRFRRAAFASLEHCTGARALLQTIGEQLVPEFAAEVGAEQKREWQLVERALRDQPTLIVIDNVESVLPPYGWAAAAGSEAAAGFDPDLLAGILELCRKMAETSGTGLVFTSRSPLTEPFSDRNRELEVGRLSPGESLELVGKVLGEGGRIAGTRSDLESREKVEELIEVLGGHARSLLLIARELRGGRKLGDVASDVRQIMADLHRRFPDDRERGLFASVELSLRKLPAELRAKLLPLGVFHGGGHPASIALVLGLDHEKDEEVELARALIEVGLAEPEEYGYLRFDPALAPFLLRELDDDARSAAGSLWAEATEQFTGFLYSQRISDPQLAAALTLRDLPNLLAALEMQWQTVSDSQADLEPIIEQADEMESLLRYLGRPRAQKRAAEIHEKAAGALMDARWSRARYLAGSAAVRRLLDAGRAAEAVPLAGRLLADATAAGGAAYEGAPHDLASCHYRLGHALLVAGDARSALGPLDEARERFQRLAGPCSSDAPGMLMPCLGYRATALLRLGHLDEAALAFEAVIRLAEENGDPRSVAVSQGNLGNVRLEQGKYAEALEAHQQARRALELLNEPGSVATAWHQIGMVLEAAGNYDGAETAYLNARHIFVILGVRPPEAKTLEQLGVLYGSMGRPEDAVRYYLEAAAIFANPAVGDRLSEGRQHNNAADALRKLGRLIQARHEVERAIVCRQRFGHAAQPWISFGILSDIERDAGRPEAANDARKRAIAAYLAYRRDTAESHQPSAQRAAFVLGAITQGRTTEAASELDHAATAPDADESLAAVIAAHRAILAGSRDPTLADDPAFPLADAAEVVLLLEQLADLEKRSD